VRLSEAGTPLLQARGLPMLTRVYLQRPYIFFSSLRDAASHELRSGDACLAQCLARPNESNITQHEASLCGCCRYIHSVRMRISPLYQCHVALLHRDCT
jgi:hypothetical protein